MANPSYSAWRVVAVLGLITAAVMFALMIAYDIWWGSGVIFMILGAVNLAEAQHRRARDYFALLYGAALIFGGLLFLVWGYQDQRP